MKSWIQVNKPDLIIISQYVRSELSQGEIRSGISTLKAIIPDILLIENTPVFPDKEDFMVPRTILMSQYKPPKTFKLSEMQIKDQASSNQLAKWAKGNDIFTMNFNSLFCDSVNCKRFSNSGWLYRDDDHLSVVGAKLTIPQLTMFLKNF